MKPSLIIGALLMVAACAQHPPPPPMAANPPPPPPPPPPTTYTVYFDYNSAQLTPAAREVVRYAADAYKGRPPGGVQVIGYTDPSGSAGYNQRLSLRRANAVATELQNDGVPQSALMVSGQGESNIEPAPGQDRRVDVTVGGPPPSS
jgi:outer membrane protein OmpA-like peptidoglycan-associated protein